MTTSGPLRPFCEKEVKQKSHQTLAQPQNMNLSNRKREEKWREKSLSPFAALRKPQMDREISTGWQTEGNKRDRAELRDQKVLKFLQGGGWNAFFRIDFLPIWKTLDQYSSKILTDVRSFWKTNEISWKVIETIRRHKLNFEKNHETYTHAPRHLTKFSCGQRS